MLARESDKLATTSRRRGNRGYGIKKYALLRTCPSNMAAGTKKGGPERGEKELKKEKMGRGVPYGEWVRVGETYGGLEKGRGECTLGEDGKA